MTCGFVLFIVGVVADISHICTPAKVSNLVSSLSTAAELGQSVEHLTVEQEVAGSIP